VTVCFKVQYPTRGAARAALRAHWSKPRCKRRKRMPHSVYRCPWCGAWHLTSKGRRR